MVKIQIPIPKEESNQTSKNDSYKDPKPAENFHKKRNYSKHQCYNCHKIGHIARECPLKNTNKIHHGPIYEDEDEEQEERS